MGLIGQLTKLESDSTLCGGNIYMTSTLVKSARKRRTVRTFRGIIVGHLPRTIQSDAYLAALAGFELFPIGFHGIGVRHEEVMCHTVETLNEFLVMA